MAHPIMESVALSAPFFKACLREDVMIGVIDHEQFLAYLPSKSIDLGVKRGVPVPKEDISLQKALQGEAFQARLPDSVYGFHFFGKTTPIIIDGEVIGAIGFGYNIQDQVMLEQTMIELQNLTMKIQDQTTNLAAHSEQLASTSFNMFESSEIALENTKEIDNVIKVINNISSQTNLLGLNASIEAARAGQAGKGFSIVADEVRKLSMGSANAAKDVSEILNNIKKNISNISEGLSGISESAKYQAEFTDEYSKMIEQLNDIGKSMNKFIENI